MVRSGFIYHPEKLKMNPHPAIFFFFFLFLITKFVITKLNCFSYLRVQADLVSQLH